MNEEQRKQIEEAATRCVDCKMANFCLLRHQSNEDRQKYCMQHELDELKEALREASEWISVDYKLPPNNKEVLMKDHEGKIGIGESIYSEFGDSLWRFAPFYQWPRFYRNNLEHGSKNQDKIVAWHHIDSPKSIELLKRHDK